MEQTTQKRTYHDLIMILKSGDLSVFEDTFEEFYLSLANIFSPISWRISRNKGYKWFNEHDADDIIQNMMMKIAASINTSYDEEKGSSNGGMPWIRTIHKTEFFNHVRQRLRQIGSLDYENINEDDYGEDFTIIEFGRIFFAEEINRCLEMLSSRYRDLIIRWWNKRPDEPGRTPTDAFRRFRKIVERECPFIAESWESPRSGTR